MAASTRHTRTPAFAAGAQRIAMEPTRVCADYLARVVTSFARPKPSGIAMCQSARAELEPAKTLPFDATVRHSDRQARVRAQPSVSAHWPLATATLHYCRVVQARRTICACAELYAIRHQETLAVHLRLFKCFICCCTALTIGTMKPHNLHANAHARLTLQTCRSRWQQHHSCPRSRSIATSRNSRICRA